MRVSEREENRHNSDDDDDDNDDKDYSSRALFPVVNVLVAGPT